ncbi:MAG TPA: hypothetical protein PLU22_12250, partial [Polyangiaceae bacterium]|nr:hypothetical protein [Polyangiaceae bacterium]
HVRFAGAQEAEAGPAPSDALEGAAGSASDPSPTEPPEDAAEEAPPPAVAGESGGWRDDADAAPGVAVVGVTPGAYSEMDAPVSSSHRPRHQGLWGDVAAGYPLVLLPGPGDSRYVGALRVKARFGVTWGQGIGFMVGIAGYSLENTVPASPGVPESTIDASTVTTTHHFLYSFTPRTRSGWTNLLFSGGVGLASRHLGGVKYPVAAAVGNAEVIWNLYLGRGHGWFLGPTAELTAISEGLGSDVGAIYLAEFGLRFGTGRIRFE